MVKRMCGLMRSFFLLLFSFFTLGLWAIGLEDLKNRNIIESLSVERIEIVDNFGEYFHGKTLYKYSYTFNSNGKITEYIGEFHRKERELFIYDKNGNILEISRYGDNESILSKKKYLYNDKGYILEEVEYNSSGSASKKRKYSYNDNDKLIADVSYSIDGTIETSRTFSYNEDNKLISKVEKSGLWSSITSITFDDNGNINEYVDHYWDNSISSTYSTLYNSEFAKIKVDKINGDGSIQHLERYTYSNNGILLKHVEYPEETDQKNYSKKIVLYNNKERTVEELYYDIGGLLITKKMFSYNEHMDIIKETVFDANNSVLYGTAYEYVYDDKGNLVKQIELKRVSEFGEIYYKPIFVIIQKIVYYE